VYGSISKILTAILAKIAARKTQEWVKSMKIRLACFHEDTHLMITGQAVTADTEPSSPYIPWRFSEAKCRRQNWDFLSFSISCHFIEPERRVRRQKYVFTPIAERVTYRYN
jgi:hypothetical protein